MKDQVAILKRLLTASEPNGKVGLWREKSRKLFFHRRKSTNLKELNTEKSRNSSREGMLLGNHMVNAKRNSKQEADHPFWRLLCTYPISSGIF